MMLLFWIFKICELLLKVFVSISTRPVYHRSRLFVSYIPSRFLPIKDKKQKIPVFKYHNFRVSMRYMYYACLFLIGLNAEMILGNRFQSSSCKVIELLAIL